MQQNRRRVKDAQNVSCISLTAASSNPGNVLCNMHANHKTDKNLHRLHPPCPWLLHAALNNYAFPSFNYTQLPLTIRIHTLLVKGGLVWRLWKSHKASE